jgi:hypothetical protein
MWKKNCGLLNWQVKIFLGAVRTQTVLFFFLNGDDPLRSLGPYNSRVVIRFQGKELILYLKMRRILKKSFYIQKLLQKVSIFLNFLINFFSLITFVWQNGFMAWNYYVIKIKPIFKICFKREHPFHFFKVLVKIFIFSFFETQKYNILRNWVLFLVWKRGPYIVEYVKLCFIGNMTR